MVITAPRAARAIFACGLAGWIANALILLASRAPLGHDETQYALAARDLLAGDEPRWFYASYGMNLLAAPGVLAGGGELALRLVPFVFGIGFVLACGWVALRAFGETTAAWTVLVVACSRPYTRLSTELLSDMPAAACLLAATALIVGELDRPEGPRWRLVLAAPLLSAALYVRYASCIPIAILCAVAAGLGWRTIARRLAPVIATAAVFALLFVPHAVMATRELGSPFAILLASQAIPERTSAYDGLVTYITSNPFRLYGTLPALLFMAALVAACRDRRVLLLTVIGCLDIVALGLASLGQARYILYGTALLTIAGTEGVRRWVASRSPRTRAALVAAALAACAIVGGFSIARSLKHRDARVAGTRAALEAAAAIRADAGGVPCHVEGVPYAQLEWYGGCSSRVYSFPDALARREPVYVVSPTGAEFAHLPGRRRVVLDIPGVVLVLRLDAESAGPGR
jgi:4-amino-4-deoxy-L-arabinose transferase-like glycosyltransferase